jgi:hypothetical protein
MNGNLNFVMIAPRLRPRRLERASVWSALQFSEVMASVLRGRLVDVRSLRTIPRGD